MKNLLLLWLLIYVIKCNVAFAEKAMSPVLLTPANFAKSISKDSIKFTWQNAQNEANAKVNAYRIIISENAQFNGYTPSTGRCNVTCVTSVINSTTFTTVLRSSNKTYYWRVQGISTIENGEWSRTGTFKTDNGAPTITSASATPSSTSLGNAINFSVTLSSSLPNNYNVKLSYGTSTVNMTGSGTSYSASQIPTQLGQQVFTVGVYDSNNALKGTVFKGNFEITKSNSPPILSLVDAATTATVGTSYSVQLQASDADNNLKSISIDWGDGVNDTQKATNGTTLTFTHAYALANNYTWSATALDSVNASSIVIDKSVIVSTAVVTPLVSVGSYTKISNLGLALPDTAVLGSGSNDWACTKDNKTGLIWEVKTTDGGLRDMSKTFTAGIGGIDSDYFVNNVNKQSLCGTTDWRLPSNEEIRSLVVCVDGKYNSLDKSVKGDICTNYNSSPQPNINNNYFPNTQSDAYWGFSTGYSGNNLVWYVFFVGSSYSNESFRNNNHYIRLVHDAAANKTSMLNDTGITTCSNATTNNLSCPVSGFPNQDAQSGRDVTNNDDSDGHAGFSFTKISSTGASLPASASNWNCVKDNVTGLMWEVKTTDGGLHDQNHTYTWYESDSIKNGGDAGTPNGGICKGSRCDTNAYVKAVNAIGYCGYKDWRMPTRQELLSIVDFGNVSSAIDINYFPNTQTYWFWSFSSSGIGSAWSVSFSFGDSSSDTYLRDYEYFVRLVR